MEWSILNIIYALLMLAGVATIVIIYYFGYKSGRNRGYTEGLKVSKENWGKDKMKIYNEIQKKAKVKTEKKDAKIVD